MRACDLRMQGGYGTKPPPQRDARRDDPAAHFVAELAHVRIVPALLEHPPHDIRRGMGVTAHALCWTSQTVAALLTR
jgi:hypothetical protein